MSVRRRLQINRPAQSQRFDDGVGAKVKFAQYYVCNFAVGQLARTFGVDEYRYGGRYADCVGNLHFNLVGKSRGNQVLAHVARHICRRTVNFCGVLARKSSAAVRAPAAVGVNYNLPARKSAVALGSAYFKPSRGVNIILCPLVQKFAGNNRVDYVFLYVLAQHILVNVFVVLARNNYRVYALGNAAFILHSNLRLSVGAEVGQKPALSHVGKALCQPVCKVCGERHKFGRLVAGVAEHHSLVARAYKVVQVAAAAVFHRAVNAHSNVGALPVYGKGNLAVVCAEVAEGIPDFRHNIARNLLVFYLGGGGNFAHYKYLVIRRAALNRTARHIVLRQHGV